jgi:hypothetical protein
MSVELRSRPRRTFTHSVGQTRLLRTRFHGFARPARPGVRAWVPPTVHPTDGAWPADALLVVIDGGLLWVSDSIARQVSRRTFLSRVGQVGLVLGLSAARVLLGTDGGVAVTAPECNVCTDTGENDVNPGACGPTEPCGNQECRSGDNRHLCNLDFQCGSPPRSVRGRIWGTFICTNSQPGKWDECCQGKLSICRDCCGCRTHARRCEVGACTGGTRWACICDKETTTSCTADPSLNPEC